MSVPHDGEHGQTGGWEERLVAGDSEDAVGCWWKGTRCEWDAYACADSGDAEGDAAGDASADAETDEVRWWNARDDEGDDARSRR